MNTKFSVGKKQHPQLAVLASLCGKSLCCLSKSGALWVGKAWSDLWKISLKVAFLDDTDLHTCEQYNHVPKVVKQAEGLSGSLMHPTGFSAAFCWLLSLQAVLRESLKGSRVLPRNWETLCGSPFQSQSKDLNFFMYYTLETTVPWTSSINFWQGEHLYSCLFTHSPYTCSYSHLPGRTNKAVKSKFYPSAASAHLIHHSPMDYNQWRKWKKCLQSSPVCKCACESVLSITPSSPDNIFNESHHVM